VCGASARRGRACSRQRGGRIVVADGIFPLSKTCSDCGGVKDTMPSSLGFWSCGDCAMVHERDVNAARNLQRLEGLAKAEVTRGTWGLCWQTLTVWQAPWLNPQAWTIGKQRGFPKQFFVSWQQRPKPTPEGRRHREQADQDLSRIDHEGAPIKPNAGVLLCHPRPMKSEVPVSKCSQGRGHRLLISGVSA
jgi:hypothetical protein